jgi:hypothetical protein
MLRSLLSALLVSLLLPIAACTFYSSRAPSNSERSAKPAMPDQWLGKWIGPEGTFLVLSKSGDGYTVQIQSLDGPNTYHGKANVDSIVFVRNGQTESIRAGSGKDTGMKWLLDKKSCLVIKTGEGFCRDELPSRWPTKDGAPGSRS